MKRNASAILQRRQQRKARHTANRQAQKRLRRLSDIPKSRGEALVCELFKTIHHFFPDLFDRLRQMEDCRRKSDYTLAEIVLAGIALFLFQQGSRNALNNKRQEGRFRIHYQRLFKLRLPHLDTVHRVLCRLAEDQLEQLKPGLVKTLLEKKVLHKYRFLQRWLVVAVDATGVMSFAEKHCEQCLHQTSKTGKTTYFHTVLEAKLITPTGLAILLATEWIANPPGEYDKQDCERKAFERLAAQLKQRYPRLPLCLTADGLYPYHGFFARCQANGWAFIVTFKDGNLPSLWEEVQALQALNPLQHRHERRYQGQTRIEHTFRWLNDLDYRGHRLHWLECVETLSHPPIAQPTPSRFVHLTNLEITPTTVALLSRTGRGRWTIENEGFNIQKHHGYALQPKYARVSWQAAKNYYHCLQIGPLINQLMILSTPFQTYLQGKITCRHLGQAMMAFLLYGHLRRHTLNQLAQGRFQIRLI
jgi:Transposase DDE domain